MATTKIHKITSSPDGCVYYAMKDKIGFLRDEIADSIAYAVDDKTGEVIYYTLSSYQNCVQSNAVETFHSLAEHGRGKFKRESPRTKNGEEVVAWHLHQNFDGMEVSPAVANEIGLKLAQEVFGCFAVVVSTHTNTENIHNHIVINAWDEDGRKWNNCNSNYRRIREVSDRLCEEYGLRVLHHTQEMKLMSYTDKDGVARKFEPTDRKIEMIKDRESGDAKNIEISDYRNSPTYEQAAGKKETNIRVITQDIDNLLSVVDSYDELLSRLVDLGYTINDKKVNGDWLKHVAFTAPGQERGTRDYRLGDFYTREKLTKYISSLVADRASAVHPHGEDEPIDVDALKHFERYDYGKVNLDDINDRFRAAYDESGNRTIMQRADPEVKIIADVRALDSKVKGIINTSGIEKIIKDQAQARNGRKPYRANSRSERLVLQIQEGFESLRFIESRGLRSRDQIKGLHKAVLGSYNRNTESLVLAEQLIAHLESVLDTPQKMADIATRMAVLSDDGEYMLESYGEDTAKLAQYQKVVEQYKISDDDGVDALAARIEAARARVSKIKVQLQAYRKELDGYERCEKVFRRIDFVREIKKEKGR